jgi:hypothetical protein
MGFNSAFDGLNQEYDWHVMLKGLITTAHRIWSKKLIERNHLGNQGAILWRALQCIAKVAD